MNAIAKQGFDPFARLSSGNNRRSRQDSAGEDVTPAAHRAQQGCHALHALGCGAAGSGVTVERGDEETRCWQFRPWHVLWCFIGR